MRPILVRLTPLLLAACAAEPTPPPAAVIPPAQRISLIAGELTPARVDTVTEGLVRLELRQTAGVEGHNVVLYALPGIEAVESFLVVVDTAQMTPLPGRALGGPEGVDGAGTADVTLHLLAPGHYLIGCNMRSETGHRHLSEGEYQHLVVLPASGGTPTPVIEGTITMELADFAFVTAEEWPSGQQLIAVHNRGAQDHLVLIDRLHPGKRLQDFMAAEDTLVVSDALGGVSRIGPGETAYYPIVLTPGTYVLTCLIRDPATRLEHVEMGMIRTVVVR